MMNSQNPFEQLQEDSVETHSLSPKVAETSNESRLQPQWLQSPNNSRRGNSSSFKNPAEETDEDDNWSISTNKNPKRSNITKYNRKQMLNLWKDLPLPAELANFPTIIVQKCLTPVALLPNEPQEEQDPNKLYKSRFLPTRTTQPRGRSQPFTSRNRGRGRSDGQRMWSHERDRDFSRNTSVGRASDMEQHKRSVSHESEPESTKWFYKDPQGEVQGPFTDLEMNEWFEAGYFSDTLLVKQMHDPEFVELRLLFKKDGTSPFFASFEKEPNEDFSQTENQTTTEHLLMADKFGLSTNVPRESSNIMQPDKFWNKPNETWNRESSERDVWQTPAPTFVQRNVNDNTLKRKEGVFLLDHSGTTIPATNTIISTLASPPVVNPINSYSTNMLPMYVDPWQQRHPSMNLQHPPSAQTFPAHPIASRPIDPQSEAPVRMQEKRMPDIWTNSESRSWNSAEQHLVPEQHTPATFAQLNTQINVVEEIKLTPSQTEQVTEPTENEKPATTVTDNKSKSQKKKEKNQKQKKQPDIKPEVKPETTKNQPTQPAAPWVPPPTESRKLSLKDIQEEELRNKKQAPQINDSNEIPDSNKQGSVASSVNPAPAKQEQKKDSSTNNPTGPAWGVSAIPKSTPRSFKEIQDAEVNVKQTTEEKKKESTPAISPQPKKPASIINPVNAAPAPKPTAAVINPEEFPSLPSQPKQSKQPKAPVAKANTVVPNNNPLTVANHNTKAQAQPTTQPKQSKSQSKKKGLVKVDPSMLSFSVTNSSRVMGEIESFDN